MELIFTIRLAQANGETGRLARGWTLLPMLGENEGFVRVVGDDLPTFRVRQLIRALPGLEVRHVETAGPTSLYAYTAEASEPLPPLHVHLAALVAALADPKAQLQPVAVTGDDACCVITLPARNAAAEARTQAAFRAAAAAVKGCSVTLERCLTSARRLIHEGCRGARLTDIEGDTLREAHRAGYYASPRACTLEDLGRTMSLSRGAVWRRLARAEAAVVAAYVARTGRGAGGVAEG